MLEVNSEYTATVESVSSDGSGVCRIDGVAVFVPYTAAGDEVKIKITKTKKRFAEGVVTEIKKPSPFRAAPDCPAYEQCGGCKLRHIEYEKQLEIKKEIVENAMRRIGSFKDFTLDEIIGMESPARYRNKMIFHAAGGKIGFYSAKSRSVVPIIDCVIGATENAAVIEAVKGFNIKELFIRKSFSTGEIMVSVSADGIRADDFIAALTNAAANVKSVYVNGENVFGSGTITDTLCGVKFNISPESFFQINPVQTEALYKKAIDYADLDGSAVVMDIYCGIGTISLCAAKRAKRVIGIEVVERAIADAKENAMLNGIENAEFFAGKAEKLVPYIIKSGEKPDAVILDPPRSGCDNKTLCAIAEVRPSRIVYVSCNPSTLARDARILADMGYGITKASAVDMFPHTAHIETVAQFCLEKFA